MSVALFHAAGVHSVESGRCDLQIATLAHQLLPKTARLGFCHIQFVTAFTNIAEAIRPKAEVIALKNAGVVIGQCIDGAVVAKQTCQKLVGLGPHNSNDCEVVILLNLTVKTLGVTA